MFKKLSIILIVLLFCSNAFAVCFFGFGDCGGKKFFLIDKNQTFLDINSDVSGIFNGNFIDVNSNNGDVLVSLNIGDLNNVYDGRYELLNSIILWDFDFNANWDNRINFYDLNNSLNYLSSGTYIPTESSIDANVSEAIASRMPLTDNNLSIPNVWAAIDGNRSSDGGFYYAGSHMTLSDSNSFSADLNGVMTQETFDSNITALDLNNSLDYSFYNCDNNADCSLTGDVNSTNGKFVNLTVTGTSTIEEDLSVIGDFNAGITGSYPLIYKKAGAFSLFGSTVSGTASMGVGVLSISTGPYSTAIGFEAEALGTSTIAMNNNSYAKGNYAMAFGNYASADGTDAVAIGLDADANISGGPGGCVAIGYGAKCKDLGVVTLSRDVNVARDLLIGNCVTLNEKIICDWEDLNSVIDLNGYMTELTFDGNFFRVINTMDLNNSLNYLQSIDLNGYMTQSTFDSNFTLVIDGNVLRVINSLDLNNSLNYLKSIDLNGYLTQITFDSNFNASTQGSADFNSIYLNTESGGFYYAGASLTLDDGNIFNVNDANLNAILDFAKYNCDNNADCIITGTIIGYVADSVFNSSFPIDYDNNLTNKPYIPTEANIDANALAVINSLDLNNSLNYLTSVDLNGYMTELTFDGNFFRVINTMDLNNSLDYLKTIPNFDSNILTVINSLDLNNSLDYLKSTNIHELDLNVLFSDYNSNISMNFSKGYYAPFDLNYVLIDGNAYSSAVGQFSFLGMNGSIGIFTEDQVGETNIAAIRLLDSVNGKGSTITYEPDNNSLIFDVENGAVTILDNGDIELDQANIIGQNINGGEFIIKNNDVNFLILDNNYTYSSLNFPDFNSYYFGLNFGGGTMKEIARADVSALIPAPPESVYATFDLLKLGSTDILGGRYLLSDEDGDGDYNVLWSASSGAVTLGSDTDAPWGASAGQDFEIYKDHLGNKAFKIDSGENYDISIGNFDTTTDDSSEFFYYGQDGEKSFELTNSNQINLYEDTYFTTDTCNPSNLMSIINEQVTIEDCNTNLNNYNLPLNVIGGQNGSAQFTGGISIAGDDNSTSMFNAIRTGLTNDAVALQDILINTNYTIETGTSKIIRAFDVITDFSVNWDSPSNAQYFDLVALRPLISRTGDINGWGTSNSENNYAMEGSFSNIANYGISSNNYQVTNGIFTMSLNDSGDYPAQTGGKHINVSNSGMNLYMYGDANYGGSNSFDSKAISINANFEDANTTGSDAVYGLYVLAVDSPSDINYAIYNNTSATIYSNGVIDAKDYLTHTILPSSNADTHEWIKSIEIEEGSEVGDWGELDHSTLPSELYREQKELWFENKTTKNQLTQKDAIDYALTKITKEEIVTIDKVGEEIVTSKFVDDKGFVYDSPEQYLSMNDYKQITKQGERMSLTNATTLLITDNKKLIEEKEEMEQEISYMQSELCKQNDKYGFCSTIGIGS